MNTNSVSFFKNEQIKPIPNHSELILAAWKIKNPENIGQIIRMGHNINAKKVIFISGDENYRESKIKKTAGFSFEQMNWEFITEVEFISLLNKEHELVILETCENSHNIYSKSLPQKAILLGGNESHGLPPGIIKKSKFPVYIPMPGNCKSMNISHALSVAAFEWYRQITG